MQGGGKKCIFIKRSFMSDSMWFYLLVAVVSFLLVSLRSLIFGWLGYYYFYKSGLNKKKKLNPKYVSKKIIKKEFLLTMRSGIVFSIYYSIIASLYKNDWTLIYTNIEDYGWIYLIFSFIALMLIHDAYFYWTHRYMHSKHGRWISHGLHHQFSNPTPWAALALSYNETLVSILIHPILLCILPLHPSVFILYLLFNAMSNTFGHSGFALKSKIPFLSESKHHFLHHHNNEDHYGLYFNFWDNWFNKKERT